jgi:Fe-S oxidoreductase
MSYKERKAPSKLESALWRVYEEGTAWEGKKSERGKWAEGLNVKVGKQAKHLLYLDDAASFDPRLQRIAQSLVKIFNAAGVDFVILGEKERSSGDEVYQIGEEAFLEELAHKLIHSTFPRGLEVVAEYYKASCERARTSTSGAAPRRRSDRPEPTNDGALWRVAAHCR